LAIKPFMRSSAVTSVRLSFCAASSAAFLSSFSTWPFIRLGTGACLRASFKAWVAWGCQVRLGAEDSVGLGVFFLKKFLNMALPY